MNIVEAFKKLKENDRLILEHKGIKYIQIEGVIYENSNYGYYEPLMENNYNFKFDHINSNEWQIIDSYQELKKED